MSKNPGLFCVHGLQRCILEMGHIALWREPDHDHLFASRSFGLNNSDVITYAVWVTPHVLSSGEAPPSWVAALLSIDCSPSSLHLRRKTWRKYEEEKKTRNGSLLCNLILTVGCNESFTRSGSFADVTSLLYSRLCTLHCCPQRFKSRPPWPPLYPP